MLFRLVLVEIDRDGIGQQPFRGPERELETGRDLDRDLLARVLRHRRRVGRRQAHARRLCRRGRLGRARQHRRRHDEAQKDTPAASNVSR
jgi:hypothetical protein